MLSSCHGTDEKVILVDIATDITKRAVNQTSVHADIAVEYNSRCFEYLHIIIDRL